MAICEIEGRIQKRGAWGSRWDCTCGKCGYKWNARGYNRNIGAVPLPKRCPGCHTRKWLD